MRVLRSAGRSAWDPIISFRVEAEECSQSENYYAKNHAVPHEGGQGVAAEVLQKEADHHGADDSADHYAYDQRPFFERQVAVLMKVPGVLGGRGGDRRRREKKRKARRCGTIEIAEERRGDGDPAARSAGHHGQRLRSADRDGVESGHFAKRAVTGRLAVGDPHDDTDEDQHRRDHVRTAPGGLGLLAEQKSCDTHRNRSDYEEPKQLRIFAQFTIPAYARAERLRDDLDPVLIEVKQYRRQRAGMKSDIKCEAGVLPAKEPRHQLEMCRAADW